MKSLLYLCIIKLKEKQFMETLTVGTQGVKGGVYREKKVGYIMIIQIIQKLKNG